MSIPLKVDDIYSRQTFFFGVVYFDVAMALKYYIIYPLQVTLIINFNYTVEYAAANFNYYT
jgi:hypothetical protein